MLFLVFEVTEAEPLKLAPSLGSIEVIIPNIVSTPTFRRHDCESTIFDVTIVTES